MAGPLGDQPAGLPYFAGSRSNSANGFAQSWRGFLKPEMGETREKPAKIGMDGKKTQENCGNRQFSD
jgi:hypothetical protein